MLFVDATIDNPEFSSQSKEALTTPASRFGGSCELPASFVKKVAGLPGLRDAVGDTAYQKELGELVRATKGRERSDSRARKPSPRRATMQAAMATNSLRCLCITLDPYTDP